MYFSIKTSNKELNQYLVNPFHLVEISPWPLTGSLGALFITVGFVRWFHGGNLVLRMLGFFLVSITIVQWWRDVIREARMQGFHRTPTAKGIRIGVILFIVSEVCFFFAFFWAFFHRSLAPAIELGNIWPPIGITPLSPLRSASPQHASPVVFRSYCNLGPPLTSVWSCERSFTKLINNYYFRGLFYFLTSNWVYWSKVLS